MNSGQSNNPHLAGGEKQSSLPAITHTITSAYTILSSYRLLVLETSAQSCAVTMLRYVTEVRRSMFSVPRMHLFIM